MKKIIGHCAIFKLSRSSLVSPSREFATRQISYYVSIINTRRIILSYECTAGYSMIHVHPSTKRNTKYNSTKSQLCSILITNTTIMTATEDDIVDEFFKTIGTIQSMKGSLDNAYYNGIKKILNKANKELTVHTGEYLHDLNKTKPDKETLQKMIAAVPKSLSHTNKKGQLPIQSAAWSRSSVEYIPLLAKEGITHQVGGHDNRGGLLVEDPRASVRWNVLQLLANMERGTNPVPNDTAGLKTMMELRESNLLLKEDIQQYGLLYHACWPGCQLRFDYFADWDAQGLKHHQFDGLPILHALIKGRPIECFQVFFKAALKHYPQDLGLLFQKDSDGKTACEGAFDKYGKDETMKAIGECIPFDDPKLPILHHVVKDAPQFMNDFAFRYPSAGYLRDEQGRTLLQASIACGTKTYKNDAMFFIRMRDEQIREIDPGTDLYPFMVLASDQTSDLSAVNYLLRRNPSLAHSGNKSVSKGGRKKKRKRK
jgi:hypothetical protein